MTFMNLSKEDVQKIESLVADRKNAHAYYQERSKVYTSFIEMENHAFSAGKLGSKYKGR
jgi:hypothetical protein